MTEDWQPESPYLIIGLFIDRLTDAQALERTCAVLSGLGAGYSGHAWVGEAEPGPFTYVSDLAVRESPWPADERPYRIGMTTGDLGPLAVSFGRGDAEGGHPVEVLLSTGVYGSSPDYWDDEDRTEAGLYRHRVATLFQGLCEQLDPAYATVEEEEPTVTPSCLVAGDERLPDDFYVSDRLRARVAPALKRFPAERVASWRTGTFVSHWLSPPEPVAAEADLQEAASVEIGQALLESGWIERR